MTETVTDQLLHQLVTGSHAEGTTRLAVAAAIEHDDRTLLIAAVDDDFQTVWHLPADLVLPGETLLHSLDRTIAVTTGLSLTDVTGYAGHHDRLTDDTVVRTFVFTVTVADADQICRRANIGHHWSSEAISASVITGDHQHTPTGTTPAHCLHPSRTDQLSAALRAGAAGLLCTEAAVELLISHQSWLRRTDFIDGFIATDTPITQHQDLNSPDIAFVDWTATLAALDAGSLPCSSSERQLLRIAASLAEGVPVDLCNSLTGLDSTNTDLVTRSIYHAAGHRP